MKKKKLIEVKNLIKKYSSLTAVNNISFDVYEGEIFGLLGPNGAGKTTTLEIIETLKEATDGTILVGGLDVNKNARQIKSMIGVQLQNSGFHSELKLKEILELFGSLYGTKVDTEKILEKMHLTGKKNSKINELF